LWQVLARWLLAVRPMNSIQLRKAAMYAALQTVLNRNQSLWQTFEPFAEAVTAFSGFADQIDALAPQQVRGTGDADAKRAALKTLGELTYFVASQVCAYAAKTGNLALKAKVDYSVTEILSGPERRMIPRCRSIHAAAGEHLAALGKYKVDAAKLAALNGAIEAYEALATGPRDSIVQSAAATKEMTRLFREADAVLKGQLDKLITSFQASQAGFYNEYLAARVIVDGGGGGEEPATPPAPPAAPGA
jgi:cytochrome c556